MTTVIGNNIRITDPSEALRDWAKQNMVVPNPEYEKKQRMGFWTGRTPKDLRLYERHGNELVLPFGVLRDILPMIQGTRISTDFHSDTVIDYGTPVPLYDYQQMAVDGMVAAKFGILKSDAGSGKTQMGIAMIKRLGRRALWLCHTADLLKQSRDRAASYMEKDLIGTITEGKVNIGPGVTFATVQTMANLDLPLYRDIWDVVIVDECFPEDTIIATESGPKEIKNITKRDLVLTMNDDGMVETRRVARTFKRHPSSLVTIRLQDGTVLHCTANHPVLTRRGYVRADATTADDEVCCLRERIRCCEMEQDNLSCNKGREKKTSLLDRMFPHRNTEKPCLDSGTERKVQADNDTHEQDMCFRKNEGTQPDVQTGDQGENEADTARRRAQTKGKRWKRLWSFGSAKQNDGSNEGVHTDCGVCGSDKGSERKWVSDKLQTGHCHSGNEAWHRGRRWFALFSRKAGSGQEKGFITEFVGVDSVTVRKPTGDGKFGGLCPDSYVYNFEVEGTHNYFANGVNVHNCHRAAGSVTTVTRYQRVLNNLSARHKYGLTATPDRSDGLIKATFSLIGPIVWEVPREAIADKIMKVKVRKIPTETEITDDCQNEDGTINFTGLITHLAEDEERNRLIATKLMEEKQHSCLILSDRLAHLERIRDLLPYEMQEKSALISGKMTSKAQKAEREAAIEQMRTGEKQYLFATYSLAKEGLDIKRLDRLFLTTPVKFYSVVVQSIGRIARVCEGKKEPTALDFVDVKIGFCRNAWRTRRHHYRTNNAEVEE